MPLNRNTLLRIRTIDACLQRRQRRWTIDDLRQACEDALYEYEGICGVSERTIQRDIELMRGDKLGYWAPIVVRERKFYEYEDPDFSITKLPLSKYDIDKLSVAMDIIQHYQGFRGMSGQQDVLARMQDQIQQQESRQQVIFIETNTKLKGLDFLNPLYHFIVKKEPIVVDYQSFRSAKQTRFAISPYLLKEFNNRWFLIGYNAKMHNVQTLALDRIIAVNRDEERKFIENRFFNPNEYLNSMVGVTRDLKSCTQRVVLRIDADQAPYVLTKPLHVSQKLLKSVPDGSIEVSLEVVHNRELERLILGYGCHIEVLAPRLLRHNIARHFIIASEKYRPPQVAFNR